MSGFDIPSAAAYIAITCAVAIVWTIFTFLIRASLRARVNGPFGLDDIACLVATVGSRMESIVEYVLTGHPQILAISASIVTLVAIHYGLGYHAVDLPLNSYDDVFLFIWIGDQLFILTEAAAMLSICALICRITPERKLHHVCSCLAMLVGTWALISWLLQVFNCPLPQPWDISDQARCLDLLAIRLGPSICCSLLEIANIAIAVYVVWKVHMSCRAKIAVMIASVSRLLVIPPLFVRFTFFKSALHTEDQTYTRTDMAIVSQVAIHLSVVLATIPCAKPFFVIFEGGVFRPPHSQRSRQTSSNFSSRWKTRTGDGHRSDSNAAMERAERAAARPTWDRRNTFARPSISAFEHPERAPTLQRSRKTVSMKLPPLVWNRRKTFARGEGTPPLNASQHHKPSTSSKSDPWSKSSSSRSSHTALQRYASQESSRPVYQNRGESYNSDRTVSQESQRTSNIMAPILRPDQGETTTVIAHDPDASRRAMLITTAEGEGIHEERTSGVIELRTEVVVTYEDADHSKRQHKNSVGSKGRKPAAS